MQIISIQTQPLHDLVTYAAEILTAGGIVLYPTDTVYGLAVDATNTKALEKLYALKGRDAAKQCSVVVSDITAAQTYATLTPLALSLCNNHLPGPLTLVVSASQQLPEAITSSSTIAVRIPNHPFCRALARTFRKPFTATSANLSGKETQKTPHAILEQFGTLADAIDVVIDAGALPPSLPSTVVDARGDTPIVLRQGQLVLSL